VSGSICFIGVFIVLFSFRVVFVIRHLFPEIRDEVPENFQETEFFTADAADRRNRRACARGLGKET
jgi:hypothetical protein